jgi:hypothetical protein
MCVSQNSSIEIGVGLLHLTLGSDCDLDAVSLGRLRSERNAIQEGHLQLSGHVNLAAKHLMERNAGHRKIDCQKRHHGTQNVIGVDRHGGKEVTTPQSVSQQRNKQPAESV